MLLDYAAAGTCQRQNGIISRAVLGPSGVPEVLVVVECPLSDGRAARRGGNPSLSATLRAESRDGVVWTKPHLHQV